MNHKAESTWHDNSETLDLRLKHQIQEVKMVWAEIIEISLDVSPDHPELDLHTRFLCLAFK